MIQRGEDLAFPAKTIKDLIRIHPAFDQLDSNGLVELAVRPLRTIDGTHTAAADLLLEAVDTYRTSYHGRLAVVVDFVHCELEFV